MFKQYDEYQKDLAEGKIQKPVVNRKPRKKKKAVEPPVKAPEPEYEYEMIDKNWTIKPIGYCHRYRGYLTSKLAQVHRCIERNCAMFKTLEQYQEYLAKKANKNR